MISYDIVWWPRAAIGILLYFQLFSFIWTVLVISFCLFYFIHFILVFIFISFHFVFKTIYNENDRKSKPSVLHEINLKAKSIESKWNKTLWERLFGRGRTTGMILWTCLIAAKELSSYLTREDQSFTPLVCWSTQLIQYVQTHNKNSVISWQCLKICTSSMQTCLEPNCNIGHKWLQPRE